MPNRKTDTLRTSPKTKALAAKLRKRHLPVSGCTHNIEGDDSFALVSEALRQLFYKALPRDSRSHLARDPDSIRKLVRVASLAAELVEKLYQLRRPQVRAIISDESRFPVLHSRGRAETEKRKAMLDDLAVRADSPFKPRGNRETDIVYRFIEEVAFPLLEDVRQKKGTLVMADNQSRMVPPLNPATAKRWSSVVADWFGPLLAKDIEQAKLEREAVGDEAPERVDAELLAGTQRKLEAKKRRMLIRLSQNIGLPRQTSPERALQLIGNLLRCGNMSALEATKAQVRIEKFRNMKPTQRDVIRGLKEAVNARLKFMLKK